MSAAFRLNMAGEAVPSSVFSGSSVSSWGSNSDNSPSSRKPKPTKVSDEEAQAIALEEMKHETIAGILATALEIVKDKSRDSELFSESYASLKKVPRVKNSEMVLGKTLGRGGFCTVHDIEKLKTKKIVGEATGNKYGFFSVAVDKIKTLQDQQKAHSQNKFAKRSGGGQYAIKRVSPNLKKDKLGFLEGSVDLAMEAKFLASCKHPNIIEMPGIGYSGPCSEDFFLVLEKLTELLPERIRYWSYQLRLSEGINGCFGQKAKIQDVVMMDRLEVALEIASGMAYLHRKKIVFRDLVSQHFQTMISLLVMHLFHDTFSNIP